MEGLKIVCISDTRGKHNRVEIDVPDGDILLHAGDFSSMGTVYQTKLFIDWFDSLPHRYKVFIAGNHDWIAQNDSIELAAMLADTNITYLKHQSTVIEGIKIFGSPWQPAFCNWAFNYPREAGEKIWRDIPDDTNILITHGPPFGIHDYVEGGSRSSWNDSDNVGCKALLNRINQLEHLKLHVFGHIHCGRGYLENGKTTFINASVLTDAYQPYSNKAFIYNY